MPRFFNVKNSLLTLAIVALVSLAHGTARLGAPGVGRVRRLAIVSILHCCGSAPFYEISAMWSA